MRETKIRWADHSWNPMSGCTRISPGCDHCYAETIATKFAGTAAYPVGFDPVFKPKKLGEPAALLRKYGPGRIFVNSMSDVHHEAFTYDEIARVYDAMLATPEHDYLVLTKRPDRMAGFFLGRDAVRGSRVAPQTVMEGGLTPTANTAGYLKSRGLDAVPEHIWIGTSIESQQYAFRAEWLCLIPAAVHFASVEPMLGPVDLIDHLEPDWIGGPGGGSGAPHPLLNWVIVGGESGKGFREMDHDWARVLRDECRAAGAAFFFKQSSAFRTETGIELDGERHEEFPFPHPADVPTGGRTVGRYTREAVGG